MAVFLLLLGPKPATQHCRHLPETTGTYGTLLNTGQNIKQRLVSTSIKLAAMSRAACDALSVITQYSSLMVEKGLYGGDCEVVLWLLALSSNAPCDKQKDEAKFHPVA